MRNWGLLSGVARNHEVWLLSFAEDAATPHALLRETCVNIASAPVPQRTGNERVRTMLDSSLPDMAWRLWSPEFEQKLRSWLAQTPFDVIQIEGIELARYMRCVIDLQPDAHIVFDDHNCEYVLQQRNALRDFRNPRRIHGAGYSLIQWRRLRRFEAWAMREADATLCVSPEDQAMLKALVPEVEPVLVPNGIDVAAYASARVTPDAPPVIVFTGKMDYRPNIEAALWFGKRVFPLLQAQAPDVRFQIVGQKPHARMDVLRANRGIEIVGAVDDIRTSIAPASVYIAPLLAGGGTRFKLLEAMALRKAIVSTRLGAEGFAAQSGREMLLADTPVDFAAAVLTLLRDPRLRDTLAANGLAFVSAHYDWRVIVPALERVYAAA